MRTPATLLDAGRPALALEALADGLTTSPHPDWVLAARAWLALRRPAEARQALEHAPTGRDRARVEAAILEHEGRLHEAQALLATWNDSPEFQIRRGFIELRQGRFTKAENLFREVLQTRPQLAEGWVGLTLCLDRLGRAEPVLPKLARVIHRGDAPARIVWAWAQIRLRTHPAEVLSPLQAALTKDLTTDLAGQLHHLRGDALDKLGRHTEAFAAYSAGNTLRHVPFDGPAFLAGARALIARTAEGPPARHGSRRPILIVGAPRSGTTLLEAMLCRHPRVASRGELQEGRQIAAELTRRFGGWDSAQVDWAPQTERYLIALGDGARRIIDKTPSNALLLGAFARLVPGATVVHVVRDAWDTAWSCYRQAFPASLGWTTDLQGIAWWLRAERELMAHWRDSLHLPIVTVRYESLVQTPAEALRPVLHAAGLPWRSEVARHDGQSRGAATASHAEVRQPLHARSVGRSAPYRALMHEFTQVWAGADPPR